MILTLLAWFVLLFTLLQFIVAAANLLWYERMLNNHVEKDKLVSVLIPARNEEMHITDIIEDILAQDYQNFELIVCDDQSEDRTAEIVQHYCDADKRISLINKDHLPAGWLGKNHACHTMATKAKGDYYLFLDADVRISGDIISQSISHAVRYKLSLISIFPKQIMKSMGEWNSVPVMNYILLTLLPLILVKRSARKSFSAANGQFMFFDAHSYKAHQPHAAVKANRVEDIAIARMFKERGLKISCQTGDDRISCRMYSSYREAVNGFSKNVIDFFGGSSTMAVLFWMITSLGVIAVILGLGWFEAFIWVLLVILTKIFVSIRSKQNILKNLFYFIPQQVSMGLFIFNAIFRTKTGKHEWKGRKI
jgi:glycosyltransferase involved in cell wall biosynthesis